MNQSEYVVRLRADVSQFKQGMDAARKQIETIEKETTSFKASFKMNFQEATRSADDFQKQLKSTSNSVSSSTDKISAGLKKLGGVVLAAFSVRAIIKFGSEAVNAASKLNAMTAMSNKAFGTMSQEVQDWAKSASESYGLSQRMALQYTSTLGSMAQGFGFSQAEAVKLSESIAGRIGDLASYYSITQDEAYSKMTAIFSGETEALKSLGIVMTQTALDQFAMANGFGKTTAQMTEQEKVMLRYKFLMEQTKLAEGDFVDSSARGSWGNQIRRLKLQIEDFKAAVGQGLIAVLTPVMQILNQLMAKIVTVANAFADLMQKLTGSGKKSVTSVTPAVSQLGTASAEASDKASTAADKASTAADKTKKKVKEAARTVMSFDQLHTLSKEDTQDTSTTNPAASVSTDGLTTGLQAAESASAGTNKALEGVNKTLDKIKKVIDAVIKKAKELRDIFAKGFKTGLGNVSFQPLLDNIERIKNSLKNIFGNNEVQAAANNFINTLTYSLGQGAGALVSMGTTVATAITGGIAQYLEQNSSRITDWLVSMFDIGSRMAELQGNFATAIADIFSVFAGDNGVSAIANFIGIFADLFMGLTELAGNFATDIETLFMQPIIDNVEGIKTALDGFLGFVASILGTLKDSVDATVDKALTVYDEHIHPFFQSLTEGVSELLDTFLTAWNDNIQPVLDKLADKFDTVWKEHIQPVLDTFLDVVGQAADTAKAFWENVLQPFIDWVIKTIMPIVAPIIENIGSAALDIFGTIGDTVDGLLTTFKDVLKFLEDVFKGDWEAVWDDVGKIFEDIFKGIYNFVAGIFNGIISAAEAVANGVIGGMNAAIGALNNLSFEFPDWVPHFGGQRFGLNLATLSEISIPRFQLAEYASGGFPEDGLFMANHNELVGEFSNGKTAVANNEQIVEGITSGVYNAVAPLVVEILSAMQQKDEGSQVVEIDGERLARVVTKYQKKIHSREYAF